MQIRMILCVSMIGAGETGAVDQQLNDRIKTPDFAPESSVKNKPFSDYLGQAFNPYSPGNSHPSCIKQTILTSETDNHSDNNMQIPGLYA